MYILGNVIVPRLIEGSFCDCICMTSLTLLTNSLLVELPAEQSSGSSLRNMMWKSVDSAAPKQRVCSEHSMR